MIQTVDEYLQAVGAWGYLVLGLAACLEYLVPPVPGDVTTILGGAYAVRAGHSALFVYLCLNFGSFVGIWGTWGMGTFLGRRLDSGSRLLPGMSPERLQALRQRMQRHGTWLLMANRFLPSFRAVLVIAAGAANIPLRRTLFYGMISALAWNALLLSVGMAIGANAERIETFFSTWRTAGIVLVVAIALAFGAHATWRRWRSIAR